MKRKSDSPVTVTSESAVTENCSPLFTPATEASLACKISTPVSAMLFCSPCSRSARDQETPDSPMRVSSPSPPSRVPMPVKLIPLLWTAFVSSRVKVSSAEVPASVSLVSATIVSISVSVRNALPSFREMVELPVAVNSNAPAISSNDTLSNPEPPVTPKSPLYERSPSWLLVSEPPLPSSKEKSETEIAPRFENPVSASINNFPPASSS